MKQNLSLSDTTRSLKTRLAKLSKYHYLISIALMVLSVAFTAFSINDILNHPVTTDISAPPGFSKTFDMATIQKIKQFKYSNQASLAGNKSANTVARTNPFSENP